LGGYSSSGGGYQSTVYKAIIDPITGDIGTFDTTNQGQLPQTLAYHTSVTTTIGGTNYIYVLGGWDGSSVKSTVYKATIDSNGILELLIQLIRDSFRKLLIATQLLHQQLAEQPMFMFGGYSDATQSTVYKATIDGSGNIGAFFNCKPRTTSASSPNSYNRYINNRRNNLRLCFGGI